MNDSEKTTGSLALKPKPQIITIPATGQDLTRPLRVAAYARVSSDSNDQLHSYAAQTAYFARLINSNPNWIFADIYADQGKGEEDQYLIEETHPPIVSQEVFDKVQQLLSRKSAFIPPRASAPHPFSCKIVCGHCGAICKRKVCRGTAYWVCQTHEKSAESCLTMQTPEAEITEAFLRVYFRLKRYGEEILTQLIQALQTAKTGRLLWSEDIISLNKRIADIASQERLLAQLKQQAIVDPDIFISRSNQLAEQRREAKLKKSHILRAEDDQTIQRTQELLDILEEGPDLLMAFDGALFSELVEKITIQNNSTAIFRLINGLELPEHFERRK